MRPTPSAPWAICLPERATLLSRRVKSWVREAAAFSKTSSKFGTFCVATTIDPDRSADSNRLFVSLQPNLLILGAKFISVVVMAIVMPCQNTATRELGGTQADNRPRRFREAI